MATVGTAFSLRALVSVYDTLQNHNVSDRLERTPSELDASGDGLSSAGLVLLLEKLVDAGLIVYDAFKGARPASTSDVPPQPRRSGIYWVGSADGLTLPSFPKLSSPLGIDVDGDDLVEDTPEIGVHALIWTDARGQKRRGWAVLNKPKTSQTTSLSMTSPFPERSPITPNSTIGRSLVSHPSEQSLPIVGTTNRAQNVFYRFAHPSIQSTAYALSLELDRLPVHAAVVDYLAENFSRCPGVEETCLHHALNVKDNTLALVWLMKCASAARDTCRHSLFIQRATQLLGLLVKGQAESELDDDLFDTCTAHREACLAVADTTGPLHFVYDCDRSLPSWSASTMRTDAEWLFTIGSIMRDVMWAQVKVGEWKFVEQLGAVSSVLLASFLTRKFEEEDIPPVSAMDVRYPSTAATEAAVAAYTLPMADESDADWRAFCVRASYIHSYVRGEEALAIMHILRGNAPAAMSVLDDGLAVVHGASGAPSGCHVLHAVCLPRLYALRSICFPLKSRALANRALVQVHISRMEAFKRPQPPTTPSTSTPILDVNQGRAVAVQGEGRRRGRGHVAVLRRSIFIAQRPQPFR